MRGALAQAVEILLEKEEQDSRRFVDMALSMRVCDVDRETRAWRRDTDEPLLEVGGRWDRRQKRWAGDGSRVCVLRVHRGQEAAARWLAEWFKRRALGPRGVQWADFRRVWTLLLVGGRRGGKTHLATVALCLFALMIPGVRVWAISPTQEETDELEAAIRECLPHRWYTYRGGGGGKRPAVFRLAHGSRILCLSGHKPATLKRGRADLVLLNEAQKIAKEAWTQIRGAIADRGGLCIISANPPTAEIGRWIEELHERARARENKVEAYEINAKDNPWIEYQALLDMEADLNDELIFRREVLGEFVPIGDIVMHSWSDAQSVRDVPAHFVDITEEFTKRHLGRAFPFIVGMDFQRLPHMAAAIAKIFVDPAEPGEPLYWLVDECIVDDADENDLVDALEGMPRWRHHGHRVESDCYEPQFCGVVMDASGFFQDAQHANNRTSEKWLRARGWVHLYYPQKDSHRNPDIVERVKATNARLKAANGRRRMFSCRHLTMVNRAMRSWENRAGVPYRRSPYAHACDAVSYPVVRFWGRPAQRRPGQPPRVRREPTARRRGFDGIV